MGIISSYENQFKNKSKHLAKAEACELMKKKQFEKAHTQTSNCQNEYVVCGLLYYTNEKRAELLNMAEELCFSKSLINSLKKFDTSNWDIDNVFVEDIKNFETIEEYVKKNTPKWKKNIFKKIGDFSNDIN